LKCDSGPGRLQIDLLAKLRHLGVYLYPCVPNTTAVTQETDRTYGKFKTRFCTNLEQLVDECVAQDLPVKLGWEFRFGIPFPGTTGIRNSASNFGVPELSGGKANRKT
jgi:hypothetical protein